MPYDQKAKDVFQEEKTSAERLMDEEKYDEALAHLHKAVELNPEFAEGYCNIGCILLGRGEFSEAEGYLLRCLEKDRDSVEAYYNLGYAYQAKSEFDKALSFYKEVVTREPKNANAYAMMGACAQYLGREDDALVFLGEALRLKPDSMEAATQLAALYIDKKEYPHAEDVLRLSLVSHSEEVTLYFSLGLVLKEQGKFESALAQFNKVVQLDENNAEGFYHLADCCMALGLLKQAEPFFAKAYKLDQTFSEAVLQLGRVYEQMKNDDSANLMYRHWLDMVEDEISVYDEARREEFKKTCTFVEAYHHRLGEDKEAAVYREKVKAMETVGAETTEASLSSKGEDYRVSLQIDD